MGLGWGQTVKRTRFWRAQYAMLESLEFIQPIIENLWRTFKEESDNQVSMFKRSLCQCWRRFLEELGRPMRRLGCHPGARWWTRAVAMGMRIRGCSGRRYRGKAKWFMGCGHEREGSVSWFGWLEDARMVHWSGNLGEGSCLGGWGGEDCCAQFCSGWVWSAWVMERILTPTRCELTSHPRPGPLLSARSTWQSLSWRSSDFPENSDDEFFTQRSLGDGNPWRIFKLHLR